MSGPWNPDGSQWPPQPGQSGEPKPYDGNPYGAPSPADPTTWGPPPEQSYQAQPPYQPPPYQPPQPSFPQPGQQYQPQQPYSSQQPFQVPQSFQGQPAWQQPGFQPGPPAKPPVNTGLILGIVLAVLIIIGGVTTLIVVNKDDPSVADPVTPTTSTSVTTTSTTTSPTTSTTTTSSTTTTTSTTSSETEEPMVVGTCAEVTGDVEDVELVRLDCADPAAAYVVIAEGVSAICDPNESEFTQNSSFGLSTKTCMAYNVAVGDCIKFGETLSHPDTKVNCADYVGDAATNVTLSTSTETSDQDTCPGDTTIYYSYSSRNSLICFGDN